MSERVWDERFLAVDCGYSQLSVALLDPSGRTLAVEQCREPHGDGHAREIALTRLLGVLPRLHRLREGPVRLVGYAYEHSGVTEELTAAGWEVAGVKALNDVLGVYGLTEMPGHAVVCGCGSWPQLVYIDRENNVCWPGDDVAPSLPEWPLFGRAYAEFLVDWVRCGDAPEWLVDAVDETIGGRDLDEIGDRWGVLGPSLSKAIDHPRVQEFLRRAADGIAKTRNVVWEHTREAGAPFVVLGGGAVGDERVWRVLARELHWREVETTRVSGAPALGLARYAMRHWDAKAWAVLGQVRPKWLS